MNVWYQKHISADLPQESIYGLPKPTGRRFGMQRLWATRVLSHGCIDRTVPLVKKDYHLENIVVDSKSGVSVQEETWS